MLLQELSQTRTTNAGGHSGAPAEQVITRCIPGPSVTGGLVPLPIAGSTSPHPSTAAGRRTWAGRGAGFAFRVGYSGAAPTLLWDAQRV